MTIPAFIWSSKAIVDSVDPIRRRDRPASNASLDIPSIGGQLSKRPYACQRVLNLIMFRHKTGTKIEHFLRLRPFAVFCARFAFFLRSVCGLTFLKCAEIGLKVHFGLKVCALKVLVLV